MGTVTTLIKAKHPASDQQLEAELRAWADQETGDWDDLVAGAAHTDSTNVIDLYDDMPEIDSKAVARTSPIFERHLGIPLDVTLIRPGGYAGIDDMVTDLIPKMKEQLKNNNRKDK